MILNYSGKGSQPTITTSHLEPWIGLHTSRLDTCFHEFWYHEGITQLWLEDTDRLGAIRSCPLSLKLPLTSDLKLRSQRCLSEGIWRTAWKIRITKHFPVFSNKKSSFKSISPRIAWESLNGRRFFFGYGKVAKEYRAISYVWAFKFSNGLLVKYAPCLVISSRFLLLMHKIRLNQLIEWTLYPICEPSKLVSPINSWRASDVLYAHTWIDLYISYLFIYINI